MIKLLVVLQILFLVSCDKGVKTPEGLLTKYIEEITESSLSQEDLDNFLAEDLLKSVSALSEDEYKNFLNKNKVKSPRIKILNKSCVTQKCTLTYVISYKAGENHSVDSEIKKVAILKKVEELGWRISEVTNVKTFYDVLEPLEAGNSTNK